MTPEKTINKELFVSQEQLVAMSPEQRAEYETLLLPEYYKMMHNDYLTYLSYVNYPTFKMGKHIKFIGEALQELVEGRRFLPDGSQVRVLIIESPPQHGKSMSATEAFPSWYWGRNPEKRVILASYNADFASRFGRRNKEKIEKYCPAVFDTLTLKKRPRTDTLLETAQGGSFLSSGIMGGIVGNPGDLIFIDDPIKNQMEADSVTYRERLWDEYLSSIKSRFSAQGYMVLILTRWHEDDIAGRLIERENWPVEVLRFPCEAEENDILGREVGDALFPEIGKDNDWLREFKATYINDPSDGGLRAWNSLYQCRPSALKGNIFEKGWWKFWIPENWNVSENMVRIQLGDGTFNTIVPEKIPKTFDHQLQSWDMSFKEGAGMDNVAGGVWANKGSRIYLRDAEYSPKSFVQTLAAVEGMSEVYPEVLLKLIEDKANGPAVQSMLKNKLPGIVMVEPKGNKKERASAVSPLVEAGNVYLPHPRLFPWVWEYIEQMANFPNAKNDDYVDMTSQALLRFLYAKDKEEEASLSVLQKHKRDKMRSLQYKMYRPRGRRR